MDQSPPHFGGVVQDRVTLAAALGLAKDDLAAGEPAQVVSTGAGHLLVPARNRVAVDRAAPDAARLAAVLRQAGGEGCYLYSPDPVDRVGGAVAYTRFFNPTMGIAEDPATGTAAGPLVARLAAAGKIPEHTTVIVEQGYTLGRPSRIQVSAAGQRIRIGGSGLVVAEGAWLSNEWCVRRTVMACRLFLARGCYRDLAVANKNQQQESATNRLRTPPAVAKVASGHDRRGAGSAGFGELPPIAVAERAVPSGDRPPKVKARIAAVLG